MQDNIERNKPTSCNDTCTRKRKKKKYPKTGSKVTKIIIFML